MNGEKRPEAARPRLAAGWRIAVCATGFGLWTSGGLWLLFHFFVQGYFGSPHPLEPWWMKLHGAFAFLSLWLFGLLWGVHILKGWSGGQRRWSGSTMVAVLALLTLTGYALYYAGDEDLRSLMSIAHWTVGLAIPLFFFIHYWARSAASEEAQPDTAASDPRVIRLSRGRGGE